MNQAIKSNWTPEEVRILQEAYVRAVEQRIANGTHSVEAEKAIAEALIAMAKGGCMEVDALVSCCKPVS